MRSERTAHQFMSATHLTPLRIAIVGAGLMGRWHACFARRLGAKIVAVADLDQAAAHTLARRHGAGVFGELADLLTSARPDAIHICTPLPSHLPLATQAVEAGVHALIEKPLTITAAQTQTLLARAAVRGVQICPVHQFGFQRGVVKAAAALGELGEVLHANFSFCSAGGGAQMGTALDAIVADILPHPLAILQALWPDRLLSPEAWTAASQGHGELHAQGRLGEMAVSIYISMHARPTRCDLEIFCRHGSLYLNFFHGYAVVRRGAPSRVDKIAQPFIYAGTSLVVAAANLAGRAWRREGAYPGLRELIAGFYAAIQGHGENPISPAQTLVLATVREHLIQQAIPDVLAGQSI